MHFRCRYCRARSPYFVSMCPACRKNGAMVPLDYEPPVYVAPKVVPTLDEIEQFEGERIDTGIPGLNRVLGRNDDGRSGLHVPSSILFGGAPGCGKTTLTMHMLAKIKEDNILLISSEQTLPEIKSTLVRIGLGSYASRIPAYSLLDDACDVNVALEKIERIRPRVLVVDSISKLRDPANDTSDKLGNRVRIIQIFKRDAEVSKRATVLIAHLNKENEISGAREEQYDVSAVMLITKPDPDDNRKRRLLACPDKNRFGDTSEQAFFDMHRKGLTEVSEADIEEEEREKREQKRQRRTGREEG